MDDDKHERIRTHAYRLWEADGRPEGRHDEHWAQAELHVGMMGDGTEEQNLGQAGDPSARITEADVQEAFRKEKTGSKRK